MVGVPVTAPVVEFRLRPFGREPEPPSIAKWYGAMPPLPEIEPE
jgi:hypothetical protein